MRTEKACEFLTPSIRCEISDPTNSRIGNASACLVDYGGHRSILTVAHATGNLGRWAIEMEFDDFGAKLWNIGAMHFTGLINFTKGIAEPLDMAYAKVANGLQPNWQERDRDEKIIRTTPRIILTAFPMISSPTLPDVYKRIFANWKVA